MKHLLSLFMLASAVFLSACVEEPTAPWPVVSHSLIGAQSTQFLVAFNTARGMPRDFAAAVMALGGTVDTDLNVVGGAIVSGLSDAAVAKLATRRDILGIEPSQIIPLRTRSGPTIPIANVGNTPASVTQPQTAILASWQWNLHAIQAPAAWAAGRLGSANVTAAILDTGLDPFSPDQGPLVDLPRSRSFVPEDDALLQTLFPGRPAISDLHGHGTNVGSIVSSTAVYFAGVTSRTKLMGVKVCSFVLDGCPLSAVLAGFEYAIANGADVINMSLGAAFLKRCTSAEDHGCQFNGVAIALFNRLFQRAEQLGVTVVVAAGNDGANLDHDGDVHRLYCDQVHVICVAATGAQDAGPNFLSGPFSDPDVAGVYSNYGRARVDVAAPGGNFTLDKDGHLATAAYVLSLCTLSQAVNIADEEETPVYVRGPCSSALSLTGQIGTSQASPHVAGLAALLVSEIGRNPVAIRNLISRYADDLGERGTDPHYGRGRINVAATHP